MHRKGNDPVITRLEPRRPRGLRLHVHLDRGDPLEDVALEALERLRLGVGDALPPPRLRQLLDADMEAKIREAALNILSYRARTRTELRRKLLTKGFPGDRVDPCLARLEERGLLDDTALASAFVRDRIRFRPRAKMRLTQELRAKGVKDGVARQAVDDVLEDEGITEAQLAITVLEGWLKRQGSTVRVALSTHARTPEREKAVRRLRGYMARRGFGGAPLSAAMDRVREMAQDPS